MAEGGATSPAGEQQSGLLCSDCHHFQVYPKVPAHGKVLVTLGGVVYDCA